MTGSAHCRRWTLIAGESENVEFNWGREQWTKKVRKGGEVCLTESDEAVPESAEILNGFQDKEYQCLNISCVQYLLN